jgi:hypothetical protein
MPRVPTYAPQVDPSSLSRSYFDAPKAHNVAADTASGNAQAMLRATALAEQLEDQLADAEAKKFDNLLAADILSILHDKDAGYLAQRGENAVKGYGGTLKSLEASRKKYEDGIENPLARTLFAQVADRRLLMARQQVDVHAAKQSAVYADDSGRARIETSANDMVANGATWNQAKSPFAVAKATLLSEVNQLADRAGLSIDARRVAVLGATTAAHANVLNQMLSLGQTQAARDYLGANVKEISADKIDDLNKRLAQSGIKDDSFKLAAELSGKGLSSAIRELDRRTLDGTVSVEVRDATVARLEHDDTRRRAAYREYKGNLVDSALGWLEENPDKSAEDMPVDMQTRLKDANLFHKLRKAGRQESDFDALSEVEAMATTRMEDFVDADLSPYVGKLSKKDFSYFKKLQQELRVGNPQTVSGQKQIARMMSVFEDTLTTAGIDTKAKQGKAGWEQLSQFRTAYYKELSDAIKEKQEKKERLSEKEGVEIGLGLLSEGRRKGSGVFRDDVIRRYQDVNKFYVPFSQIPIDARAEMIKDYVSKFGHEPTEEEIEVNYPRYMTNKSLFKD